MLKNYYRIKLLSNINSAVVISEVTVISVVDIFGLEKKHTIDGDLKCHTHHRKNIHFHFDIFM